MTPYVDTVDVARIAFRISCRYPKPGFWARSRPEFLTARAPDVLVAMTYDEDFPRHAGDTASDAPRVQRRGRALLLTTAYYRATADLRRGRVAVRIAAGFGVANLMRTLAALCLLERGTLLLRAVRFGRDGAMLACGVPEDALSAAPGAVAGYLAVTPGPRGVVTRLTPFIEGDGPLPKPRTASARVLWVPAGGPGPPRPVSTARAVGGLLPAIWPADRRRAALERTLDLATRIAAALRCQELGVRAREEQDVAVG